MNLWKVSQLPLLSEKSTPIEYSTVYEHNHKPYKWYNKRIKLRTNSLQKYEV